MMGLKRDAQQLRCDFLLLCASTVWSLWLTIMYFLLSSEISFDTRSQLALRLVTT